MTVGPPRVRPLEGLDRSDTERVGTAAANLGEMVAAGVRVPSGFVVEAGGDSDAAGVPVGLRAQIARAYSGLGVSPTGRPLFVTVRPSVPGPYVELGGGRTTVRGHAELVEAIAACRAAWSSDAAVVVQMMIPAQQSGLACTADPLTGDDDRIVVKAVLGQSEIVLSGAVEPDTYVFRVPGIELRSVHVGHQAYEVGRGRDGRDQRMTLDPWHATARVLDDGQATAVARAAWRVREHFGCPQDVEWAMVARRLWLLSTYPSCPRLPEMRPPVRAAYAEV